MAFAILSAALPLVIFLGLIALPEGRPAMIGVLTVGVLIVLFWLSRLFPFGPFFTGDSHADGFMAAAGWLYTGAWALASLLQLVRLRFGGGGPRWLWPVLAAAMLGLVGVPAMRILGF